MNQVELAVLRKVAMVCDVWPFVRAAAVDRLAAVNRDLVSAACDQLFLLSQLTLRGAADVVVRDGGLSTDDGLARLDVAFHREKWRALKACLDACTHEFQDDWEVFVTVAGSSLLAYRIAMTDIVALSDRIATEASLGGP